MEIIQEQNLIFAQYNKDKSNRLLSSYIKPQSMDIDPIAQRGKLEQSNQQLSSSNPTSDFEDSSSETEAPSTVSHEDEREIGLIANILLNISSTGVPTGISLSSSTSSSSQSNTGQSTPTSSTSGVVPNYDSPVLAPTTNNKLVDTLNIVPLDLAASSSSQKEGGESLSLSTSTSSSSNLLNDSTGEDKNSAAYKKKRQRTSPEQLAILEQIFETDKMPSQQIRIRLANQLGMSSRRVQIWFQNKRAKVKRGVFTDRDDDNSMLADDDEEDDDDNENNLTIDEITTPSLISTSPPILSQSTDNIVPSISPLMLSTNGSAIAQQTHQFSLSASTSSLPSFTLSSSTNGTTNAFSGKKKSASSIASSSNAVSNSPTQQNKKHRSRPSSPTQLQQQQQFNFTPVSFSTPTIPTSQIKLNSSSIGIPTNPTPSTTPTFKQYNFSFDHHTTATSAAPPPPQSEYKEIRFHNVTLK